MPRRTRIQQERDRVRTSELYLKGWSQSQIAAEIGVTQAMISRNLQICRDEWKEITAMHIDDHKAKELAKIDALEQTYWDAWQRSKDDVETRSSRMVGEGEESSPTKLERIVKTENQSGNEKYLIGVQWCINKRCEILRNQCPDEDRPDRSKRRKASR